MTNETPQPGAPWTPGPNPTEHLTGEPQDPHAVGYGYSHGYGYPPPVASPARRTGRAKRTLIGVAAAALATGLVASGVVIGHEATSSDSVASSLGGSSSSTDGNRLDRHLPRPRPRIDRQRIDGQRIDGRRIDGQRRHGDVDTAGGHRHDRLGAEVPERRERGHRHDPHLGR